MYPGVTRAFPVIRVSGDQVSEGYISSLTQIISISIDLPLIRVTASCGQDRPSPGSSRRTVLGDPAGICFLSVSFLMAETILESMDRVNDYSVIWKRTAGGCTAA